MIALIVATKINLLEAKLKQHFPTAVLPTKVVTTVTRNENMMY